MLKEDKPRELALKALALIEKSAEFSGGYLEKMFQGNRDLDERDRAFAGNIVQGTIRWRARLDYIIGQFSSVRPDKIDPLILNILRLALYQIFFMDRVPDSAAVNSSVNLAKKEKGQGHIVAFVNGILRNICRNRDKIIFPEKKKNLTAFLSSYYSYPSWLVKKWVKELGESFTEELLEAQNRFPDLNIRANRLKTNRDELAGVLAEYGVNAEPMNFAPEGLILKKFRGRVERFESFKMGMFQVQDQAAQIVSHLLSPSSGDRILDICAGLGGKTTHLQEIMGNSGRVLAVDMNLERLVNNRINCGRLGVSGVDIIMADAGRSLSWLQRGKFNKALIDAPCSGLGVISRHPDIKWNRKADDIERMSLMQKKITENSFSAVKSGGIILYAVCSISKQENEDIVEYLLKEVNDISLVDMRKTIKGRAAELIDSNGFLRTYPGLHSMDGFFAALFKKN